MKVKKMSEKHLNWLIVMSLRYALNRDNGIAFENFVIATREALDFIKVKTHKEYTVNKLVEEIRTDLSIYERKDKQNWQKFVNELLVLNKGWNNGKVQIKSNL